LAATERSEIAASAVSGEGSRQLLRRVLLLAVLTCPQRGPGRACTAGARAAEDASSSPCRSGVAAASYGGSTICGLGDPLRGFLTGRRVVEKNRAKRGRGPLSFQHDGVRSLADLELPSDSPSVAPARPPPETALPFA
jgi:hypothetical protein